MNEHQAETSPLRDLADVLEGWLGRPVAIEIHDRASAGFFAGMAGRLVLVAFDDSPEPGGLLRIQLDPGPQELVLFADLVDDVRSTSSTVEINHRVVGEIVISLRAEGGRSTL